MKKLFFTLFLLFFIFSMSYSRNIEITIYNSIKATHNLSNSFIYSLPSFENQEDIESFIASKENKLSELDTQKEGWSYGGNVSLGLTITPEFKFSESFQADSLINVYFSKNFNDTRIQTSLKEAYIDFLFYDLLSLRSGFIKVDYGYNGYFHPLNVTEIIPEIKNLYGEIILGNENMGFMGVPAVRVKLSLPELITNLNINLEETMVWLDFNDLKKNYFLSYISLIYLSYNFGFLIGDTSNIFDNETDKKLPTYGLNFSAALPFNILLFWEALYKQESYRGYVENGVYKEKKKGNFIDTSIKLQWENKEPIFNNKISLSAEYFYYEEGLTKEEYDKCISFLTGSSIDNYLFFNSLIIPNRNFKNYWRVSIGYSILKKQINFNYSIMNEVESQVYQHRFTISKLYNDASIGLSAIYTYSKDKKYQLFYGAEDWVLYFFLSKEL